MKTAILADSGCQLSSQNGIYVVPLQLTVGAKNYLDEVDITTKEVFTLMDDEIVMTSQPSTGSLIEAIQQIKKDGYDHILAITIATGLSSSLNGFKVACEMEEIDVTLVDTHATAGIHRYLVLLAKRLLDEGKDVTEVKEILDDCVKDSDTLILVPNVKHLKRGGRITPAVAMLAGMLKIVPVMKLNHELGGKIDSFAKVRTMKKAHLAIIDYFKEHGINDEDYDITIEHVLADDEEIKVRELLKEKLGINEVHGGLLPAVVGAHMGTGGFGYQFVKKYKQ